MLDKAPDAFRTISEAAEELDLPQHVLRFWETRFPQIKPLKRGGGRRYYRPDDMDLLRGIRELLHRQRYTIQGVQKLIREQGVRAIVAVGRDPGLARPALQPAAEAAPAAAPAARASLADVVEALLRARDHLRAARAVLAAHGGQAPSPDL